MTLLKKWGNSIGVRFPKAVLDELSLQENSRVILKIVDGGILIKPEKSKNLQDMLDAIKPENLHNMQEWTEYDEPRGNEVW